MNPIIAGFANEIFVAVTAPVVVYVAVLARSFVKAKIKELEGFMDEAARKRLEDAFENAIAYAEKKGTSVTLEAVTGYVQQFNPGDLARFKLSGEALKKRATAAIAKAGLSK